MLDIVSRAPKTNGKKYMQWQLDGIRTIGVFDRDQFGVFYHNTSSARQAVRVSVDGTNVLTGERAGTDYHNRDDKLFIVEPGGLLTLDAWAENHEGGARFVFTHEGESVAVHTHGDVSAVGYISVLVWDENAPSNYVVDPIKSNKIGYDILVRGGAQQYGLGSRSAVGAGENISQHIGETHGLTKPGTYRLEQVRHMWWDEIADRVGQMASATTHPTGFVSSPEPLANLGTTPRWKGATTEVKLHQRFVTN